MLWGRARGRDNPSDPIGAGARTAPLLFFELLVGANVGTRSNPQLMNCARSIG